MYFPWERKGTVRTKSKQQPHTPNPKIKNKKNEKNHIAQKKIVLSWDCYSVSEYK